MTKKVIRNFGRWKSEIFLKRRNRENFHGIWIFSGNTGEIWNRGKCNIASEGMDAPAKHLLFRSTLPSLCRRYLRGGNVPMPVTNEAKIKRPIQKDSTTNKDTIHSSYFHNDSSSPILLRSASDTERILCRSFTPKLHRQLRVKDLPKVPTRRIQRDSNLRPFKRKTSNLPMSHHTPPCCMMAVQESSLHQDELLNRTQWTEEDQSHKLALGQP